MPEATILIPTHDHAAVLPISVRSALAQQGTSVEVFVVGDGVGDDTRIALEDFAADGRVRFFDMEKGARHGERNRHVALQETQGEIVCYLSDDDVLLPWHVAEMQRLLEGHDFAHSVPVLVNADGALVYRPADLARPEFRALIRAGRNNFISLTGAAHTRSLYERLPYGWRPAPTGIPTDIHMWMQVFSLADVRCATATKLTAIHFPDPSWRTVDPAKRAAALESWLVRGLQPGAQNELQAQLEVAVRLAAQDFKLRSIELSTALADVQRELEHLSAPWWRRLGRRALRHDAARRVRERFR